MGNIKEWNIKNQTYYFFNSMINMKDFDPNLLKIDKKSYKKKKKKKKNRSKYLVFDSTNENNQVLKKYAELKY